MGLATEHQLDSNGSVSKVVSRDDDDELVAVQLQSVQ